MKFLVHLFFLTLFFCSHSVFAKQLACRDILGTFVQKIQRVNGTNYKILELAPQRQFKDFELIYDDEVFLGVSKGGHFYLKVGSKIHEGGYFPLPVSSGEDYNYDGYLFHFPNVSKDKINEWNSNFQDGVKGISLSCVRTACKELFRRFDIKISNRFLPLVFSNHSLNQILKNGFLDSNGDAVDFKIIRTSKRAPMLKNFKEILVDQDLVYGVFSFVVSVGSGLGLYNAYVYFL